MSIREDRFKVFSFMSFNLHTVHYGKSPWYVWGDAGEVKDAIKPQRRVTSLFLLSVCPLRKDASFMHISHLKLVVLH